MIENERQRAITEECLNKFRGSLSRLLDRQEKGLLRGVNPVLFQAEIDAVGSEIEVLEGQIAEWDKKHPRP